jgi:hypothetical protein
VEPASSGEVVSIPSQGFHQSLEHQSGGTTILSLYPEERVRSAVYVMKSHGLAVQDLGVSLGSQGRACLSRAFSNGTTAGSGVLGGGMTRSESGHEEATFTQMRVGALRVHLHGVQVEGMRMTARLAAAPAGTSGRSPYFEDVLGFVSGPSEVFLKVTSSPHNPAATDSRLLSLLYHRARQASL